MLDNNLIVQKEEVKTYEALPKNVYQVELLSIDLRDATGQYAKEGDKNFCFQFTLLDGKDKGESLRGRNLWNNFVKTSLFIGKKGKCNLWEIVEAFLGRELTQQEQAEGLTGSTLNSFIGQQIKVFADQVKKGDKIYNVITSYMPVEVRLTSLTSEEKEEARVKVKKEDTSPEPTDSEKADVIIKNIPF